MPKYHIHVCCFSEGLDDLPLKKQRDPLCVARHLARAGRFSVFEASANQVIAETVTWLMRRGWIEMKDAGFPWTKAKLSPAGAAALGRPYA